MKQGNVANIRRPTTLLLLLTLAVLTPACSNLSQLEQRTLSGGAIGAAGGAVIAAIAGGGIVVGTLVGAGAGAAIGALTTERK